MIDSVVVRFAAPPDVAGLVELKTQWAGRQAEAGESEQLTIALDEWLRRSDVVCAVADDDGQLVGMAWMVVFERAPNLGDVSRHSADVQSVFVIPSHRGRGVGAELVRSLCDAADRRAIPRVTVHSSTRAIDLYRRAGFAPSPVLLQREI
ncbi:GNAT family N-acetyltransferase [Microbacterium yannicii]|uniref:GNAT family N-acetyltransferase n=1 Tax=Microbacterium yannicii TaxID=671622 RepID=A0ABP9LWN4_9MICO|nr:GNAT family N-acetyltransferase [Microbacterium yannicii]MCO5953749.1 GNAT family N-acetyltransferase [Microbacterium yannicii]